jgi:hypothetical protein
MAGEHPVTAYRRDRLAMAVGLAIASIKGIVLLALAWWLLR